MASGRETPSVVCWPNGSDSHARAVSVALNRSESLDLTIIQPEFVSLSEARSE